MKQFDLSEWLEAKSRKVVTRDGREAIIVSTDADKKYPVVAKMNGWDCVFVELFDKNGRHKNEQEDTIFDLFFADEEEELTQFEKAVRNILARYISNIDCFPETIKSEAESLLDLARKEILKDLPKWKKSDRNWITNICDLATIVRCDGGDHEDYDSVVVSNRVDKDDYYIELGELLKLPKEE